MCLYSEPRANAIPGSSRIVNYHGVYIVKTLADQRVQKPVHIVTFDGSAFAALSHRSSGSDGELSGNSNIHLEHDTKDEILS